MPMSFKGVWAAVFVFIFWFGGFLWFVYEMPTNPPCPNCTTDAIVVLTGGNNRIASALELLDQKLSDHLLISGVKPGTTLDIIKKNSGFQGRMDTYKITLDDQSRSTKENALYTQKWVKQNDYHSILLVTANYHMRRSLLEFQQAMPNILIIPHPISPQEFSGQEWNKEYKAFCLFLYEYHKYLGALLRSEVKYIINKVHK
jgi:uncharacterized SAM-binding protein YcdF (DUF218 family)